MRTQFRIISALLIMTFSICHCSKVAKDTSGGDQASIINIRLVSYNVGVFMKATSQQVGISNVAEIITKMAPAAVALMELDSCTTRSQGVYQLQTLSEKIGGYSYHFTGTMPYYDGKYGLGILYGNNLEKVAEYSVLLAQEDGYETRGMSVVEFDNMVMASVHLDHKSMTANLHQAKTGTEWVNSRYGKSKIPVFLCGDFNVTPSSETVAYLKENWVLLSDTDEYTYSTSNPSKCIDYIFALRNKAEYQVTGTGVYTLGVSTVASDHYPVWVKINIKNKIQ